MIINLTTSQHSKSVVAITFHALNNDWFTVLFPVTSVELYVIKNFYVGKDFYQTKKEYKGKILEEADMAII